MKFQLEAGRFSINVSLTHTHTGDVASIRFLKVNPVIQIIIWLVYESDYKEGGMGKEKNKFFLFPNILITF